MDNKTKWKLYDKYNFWANFFGDFVWFGLMGVFATIATIPFVVELSIASIIYAICCLIISIISCICKFIFEHKRDVILEKIENDD